MYCSKCANELTLKEVRNEGNIPYCKKCNELYFPKVYLAMITILINNLNQICLVEQSSSSKYKVLLAGYIKPKERLEECVKREVKEEVGINVSRVEYLNSHYYDQKDVLMYGFASYTNEYDFEIDLDEIYKATWYDQSECLQYIREGSIAYKLVKQYIESNMEGNNEKVSSKISQ